ncbi:MAG TPA: glutamine ABC transporter ATP-binding protein, partial [Burkholderiaceae bacterium]|nr:glutamine ABC transporter ATP-binding protein [Burkholderiaceae bacterium]
MNGPAAPSEVSHFMFSLLISLSSFGAAEVGRHGQRWCTDLAAEAGADGVEVRGEMLRDPAAELAELRGRAAVYSSPDGLFRTDGSLDTDALAEGLRRAQLLQAPRLKMAIGGFDVARSRDGLDALRERLA